MELTATPWDESSGTCDCCGRTSKMIWGDVSSGDATLVVYYVSWTEQAPEHYPNIDLIIGAFGDNAKPEKRVLVSLLFRPDAEGGQFMVVDGDDRPANKPELCGRAMKRAEVIGSPLADEAFALLDALWLSDPRIAAVKELNNEA